MAPGSSHARPGQADLLGTPPSNLISPRSPLPFPPPYSGSSTFRPRIHIALPIFPRERFLEGTFQSPLDRRIPIYFIRLHPPGSSWPYLPPSSVVSCCLLFHTLSLSILSSSSSSIEQNELDGKHSPSRRRTIAQTSPSARELYAHPRVLYAFNVYFCLSDPRFLFHPKGQFGERPIDESALYIKSWSNCFIFGELFSIRTPRLSDFHS